MTKQRRRADRAARSTSAMAVCEGLECRRLLAAELVKDINDVGGDAFTGEEEMIEYAGALYFFAQDLEHGTELWRSDGTEAGTALVKDVRPGSDSVFTYELALANDLLFFVENTTDKLWRSDGTEAGTFELAPAQDARFVRRLVGLGDELLFVNADGNELWTTDGSVAGTRKLASFGSASPSFPRLGGLTELNGTAYFWAEQSSSQYRLWRSDGTGAGTVPADGGFTFVGEPRSLTPFGSRLLVSGARGLFLHDPASGETTALNEEILFPQNLASVGSSTVFFTASTPQVGFELWRTDGTQAGTRLVADLVPGFWGSSPGRMSVVGEVLYFIADDNEGVHALWRIAPAEATPTRVMEFTATSGQAIPRGMTAIGDELYIAIANGVLGDSIWVSDGSAAGTRQIAQFPRGGFGNSPQFVPVGASVFFVEQDGVTGRELWKTDGTAEGTGLVKDIRDGTASAIISRQFEANGLWYFEAAHGALGWGLWRTDGTAAGTIFLAPVMSSGYLGEIGQNVFFSGEGAAHGNELWMTDGTASGTRLVKDIEPGFDGARIDHAAVLQGALYFDATVDGRQQLWKSDGTETGTVKVMDINGQLLGLGSDGERLFLRYAGKVWTSDGTEAGTTLLSTGRPGSTFLDGGQFTATERGTFFVGRDSFGSSIWITDGTPDGTRPVGSDYAEIVILAYTGGTLFFAADDGVHGQELWRTDGTDAGTYMLADAKAGPAGQFFREIFSSAGWMVYDDLLLVQLTNANNERQLWRSDGTVDGTYMLPLPGVTKMAFTPSMTVVGGLAYLADGDFIWSTDGSIAGTKTVGWKPEGSELGSPSELMSVNGDLLFAAHDPVIGRELWRLDVPDAITITGTDGDDDWYIGNLEGGRVGVWRDGRSAEEPADFEWDLAEVASLTFVGGGGDDKLFIAGDAAFPITFDGGGGSDRIGAVSSAQGVAGNFEVLEVFDGAEVGLLDSVALDRVHLSAGGTLVLQAGRGITLRTKMLTLNTHNGDVLDVNDNTLIVEGREVTAIEPLVAVGRNGGARRWDGPGIKSTFAADGSALKGLNVVQVGNDVVVKYGYNGDVNVDGRIDADDYFRIDSGFLAQPASPVYAQGDFNFDDRIDADDYFMIDSAFLGQGLWVSGSATSVASAVSRATAERGDAAAFVGSSRGKLRQVRPAMAVWDMPLTRQDRRRGDDVRR